MIQTEPTPTPESLKFVSERIISEIGTDFYTNNANNGVDLTWRKAR